MNDRYLYRAKRIDNVEWEIGSLICLPDGEYEIANRCTNPPDSDQMWKKCVITHKVDPSTICQCTGLKDKNGKLIWENDIMVAHLDDVFPEDETYKRVLWHNNGFCTNENHSKYIEPIDEFDKNHFEVCGNLFDNPELLEVGE